MAAAVCLSSGCWEVIPYRGEAASSPDASSSDASSVDQSTEIDAEALFGDSAEDDGAGEDRPQAAPAAEIVPPTDR